MHGRSLRSEPAPPARPKKKHRQSVRARESSFRDLERLCATLNRLSDPNDSAPLSFANSSWPNYTKYVKAEREAWRLASQVLEPLGMIHRLVPMKRRERINWAYSHTCLRFTSTLGRYAQGDLKVERVTKWPRENDSPVRLRATVERPSGVGHDNWNQYVAVWVWKVVFEARGYRHLRTCLTCDQWFVDRGRNQAAKFCGRSCTDRYWNRGRRRASAQLGTSSRKGKRKGARP